MNKIPIILLIPNSVNSYLEDKNPDPLSFQAEDHLHLFGVYLPYKVENKQIILITHTFTADGLEKSWGRVSTSNIRQKLQLINNGLTISASLLNLYGETIGNWHTHPDNFLNPSITDMEAYKKSSNVGGLSFWIAPIASRNKTKKITNWYLYSKQNHSIQKLSLDKDIIIINDDEVDELHYNLLNFLNINPQHFIVELDDLASNKKSNNLPILYNKNVNNLNDFLKEA